MFEGPIVPESAFEAAAEGTSLRAPAWPEIVARLAVAHDLRHAVALSSACPSGNFNRFGEHAGVCPGQGERPVNRDGLVHGKGHGGMVLATAECAAPGDRETR